MSDRNPTPVRGATLPGLDGLRAVAVLLVVLFHQHILKMGWVGVQLFFVLSGYLITRLLYRASAAPLGTYLRDFYGRRTLRIFPVYYSYLGVLSLALLAGMSSTGVAERLPYAALYLSNFYEANAQDGGSRWLMHFWSLAVEEQFYLVWPFLIYFCPRHSLRRVLILIALMGPLFRYSIAWSFVSPASLTIAHIDAFAIGALSSLYPLNLRPVHSLVVCGLLGPASWVLMSTSTPLPGAALGWGYIFGLSLFNVATAILIEALVRNQFAVGFFENRIMKYLGKISYGIYIFHYPVQSVIEKALPAAPLLVRLALQLAATVAIAGASFALLESRFLALKDRWFPTTPRSITQQVSA